jgi:hypothetical protein
VVSLTLSRYRAAAAGLAARSSKGQSFVMKRPSSAVCLALVLSFSGCTCEYHTGTSRTYQSSGGERVVVVEDPQGDWNERVARDRREREAQRPPHRAGDPNKSIHAGPAPRGPGTGGGTLAPRPSLGSNVDIGGSAPAPAGSASGGSVAQPTPVAPAPAAEPTPAPAPAQPAPAQPAPTPAGDTYVRARNPTDRAGAAGGAGVVADPAKNSKAPRRGPMGRKN